MIFHSFLLQYECKIKSAVNSASYGEILTFWCLNIIKFIKDFIFEQKHFLQSTVDVKICPKS